MTTTENLPAKAPADTIKTFFMSPAVQSKIAESLPKTITPERMTSVVLMQISQSELLSQCTRDSLLRCVLQASTLGLSFAANMGQAYMVPFKRNRKDASGAWHSWYEATFIVGYRGLVTLARRSGEISNLYAVAVFEDDEFQWVQGSDAKIVHVPNIKADRTPETLIAVYMIAKLKDGSEASDVMTKPEVLAIKKRSKSSDNGPWVTDFIEMAKKTVVRRGAKYLPLSPEDKLAEALERDQDIDLRKTVESIVVDRLAQANTLQGKLDAPAASAQLPQDEPQDVQPEPHGGPVEDLGDGGNAEPTGEPNAPQTPATATGNPGEPSAAERLVIEIADAWGSSQVDAFDKLTATATKRYGHPLDKLTEPQIANLRKLALEGGIKR